MADLVIVTIILAFTALCVAYISWCDRIIGPDELQVDVTTPGATTAPPSSAETIASNVGGVAAVAS
jgi:hypothetical protein